MAQNRYDIYTGSQKDCVTWLNKQEEDYNFIVINSFPSSNNTITILIQIISEK